ncbi:MAG: hypothetical protein KDH09_16710 [Chrysiogenetes bacterium]|nr:hypothetical protein [Chrysiogenetes bacterium]
MPAVTPFELRKMPREDLVILFKELPSPSLEEMNGEFAATLLDQGAAWENLVGKLAINLPGKWRSKAFLPVSSSASRGYNGFVLRGRDVRRFQMRTSVGASKLTTGESYHLDYSTYNGGYIGTMRDEVRKVDEHLYLGIGRVGFTKWERRRLLPFLLEGPDRPFDMRPFN